MKRWIVVLIALLALGACLSAAGLAPNIARTPQREITSAVNDQREAAALTPPAFRSGGIGLTLAEWEQRMGPGEPLDLDITRYAGAWDLLPLGSYVAHLERIYRPPVSVPFVQGNVKALLPADAQLIDTYTPDGRPEARVELYTSPALAARVGAAVPWTGGEPGQFIVLFKLDPAGAVARVVLSVGNNP